MRSELPNGGMSQFVAVLPGLGEYTDSSDSVSSNSEDEIDVKTRRVVSNTLAAPL